MNEPPQVWADNEEGSIPTSDCEGEVAYFPNLTVVPVNNYPGFDFALHISGGGPVLPSGCDCASSVICLDLLLDFPDVLSVGVTDLNGSGKGVDLVYETPWGYTKDYRAPKGLNSMPKNMHPAFPEPFSLCIEELNGDLLLFDFVGTLPSGTELEAIVNTAGGICIVDNIDNPHG